MNLLKKIPNWLKTTLKIILSIAALLLVFNKIDFQEVIIIIKDSNWILLIPAFISFILSKLIASYRLNKYFENISVSISNTNNIKLYWLGMFYNLFLPGGIGGDGYKIYILNKKFKASIKTIFQAVILDRISGLSALISLALLLSIFIPVNKWIILICFLSIPIIIITHKIIIKQFFRLFIHSFNQTSVLSILVQVSQLITVIFIILALRINNHLEIYLFIFLLSSVVATIPFTIGGVGARELTFLYMASWLNLDYEPAISISFLFFTITAIVSLYGIRYNFDNKLEQLLTK